MVRSRIVFSAVVWLISLSTFAQDRYMVFFTDKDNVPFTIDAPEAFLSQRAIDRRDRMDIPITEMDLPVDQSYINQVADSGAEVFFTSKWFNGVLAEMTSAQATQVANLSFVDRVDYVAAGAKLTSSPGTYSIAETFEEPDNVNSDTRLQLLMLGADDMHEDGYRGEGMIIAVFDSGFPGVNKYKPFEHIFEEERLVATKDFIRNSGDVFQYHTHGTSVLSNIASDYNKVIGTAPKASYVLCVTEDVSNEYRIEEYNWLFAAEFADSIGVDIINGSLGYSTFSDSEMNYSYEDLDGHTTVVSQAAKMASDRGILVVVSAGNEGNGSWKYITSPADAENILTVGSVTSGYSKSGFSSIGPTADGRIKPDVCAMGTMASIFSTSLSGGEAVGGRITTGNGTSFSSPQIAGFAAGIWQANPHWTNLEVIESLKLSGTSSLQPDTLLGYGVPKYQLAVNGATIDAIDVLDDKLKVYPNPFSDDKITLDFDGMVIRGKMEILVQDGNGKKLFEGQLDGSKIPSTLEISFRPTGNGVYYLILRSKRFNKTVKLIKI
ncbi:S8 family serine peptidase [Marinoscillum sp.]|uniref:S8 family serine peptidase n=1 Tax=Marinoscillum sp. TaxID=2024838 RepID=UPI003BAB6FDF